MFDAFLKQLKSVQPKPHAIVWTGDYTPHDIWNETSTEQLQRLQRLAKTIENEIDVPCFLSMGNHDTYFVDQFQSQMAKSTLVHDDFRWLLDGLAGAWQLPASAAASFRQGGYYAATLTPGLRVLAINSAGWDGFNWYLYLKDAKADDMIHFVIILFYFY